MRLLLAAVIGAFVLGACSAEPIRKDETSNPNIGVELLFEHEGCRVYRFYDGGITRYYVRCAQGSSAVETFWVRAVTTSIGKTTSTTTYREGVFAPR